MTYPFLINNRLINWDLVDERLGRYDAIGRTFSKNLMAKHMRKPPYFCHYMAWRLGTWRDESLFQRLNGLIEIAASLSNWEAESRSLIASADFAEFWSLMWQLQVAEFLQDRGEISWFGDGPDLLVNHNKLGQLYVECYVYRKSFGMKEFIEEVLSRINPNIKVDYDWCMQFSLPKDNKRQTYFSKVLDKFADPEFIESARLQAKDAYPVVMHPKDDKGIVIYMNGDNPNKYSALPTTSTGDPGQYLQVALNEIVAAKQNSNRLVKHRPNIVMANMLLSGDFQLAVSHCLETGGKIQWPELGSIIDNIAISTVGINNALSLDDLKFAREIPPIFTARQKSAQ